MNWKLILYLLENFTIIKSRCRNFDHADCILLFNHETQDMENTILIASDYTPSSHFSKSLVIYVQSEVERSIPKCCDNYICLSRGNAADIANVLLMAKSHLDILAARIAPATGNQEVIDIVSSFLGRPMFYFDASYRILAITQMDIPGDKEWEHMKTQGFLSTTSARQMLESGDLDLLADKDDPYHYKADYFPCHSLVCNIRLNNRFYSRMNMLFDTEPNQLNIQECRIVCSALLRIARSANDEDHYTGPLNHMVFDLLRGQQLSEELIYDRLAQIPHLLRSLIQVCCIETNATNDPQVLKYYTSLADRLFLKDNVLTVEYEGKIVLILHAPDEPSFEPLHRKLDSLLISQGLKGGVSNLFQRFNALRDHYLQALATLSFSPGPAGLVHFREIYFDYLLSFIPAHQALPMVSYGITHLNQLQKDYQFPLADTLRTYLECGCNLQLTAEKLFIHKNTALYRLNHIKEILGADLDDSDQRMQLLFSFKILEKYPSLL